jgi:outer membrane protein assembly factor BamB
LFKAACAILQLVFLVVFSQALCAQSTVLLGTQTITANRDYDSAGQAEAFQVTASSSGTLSTLTVYVGGNTTASTLFAGLYSDASGSPGALLAGGSLNSPASAAWNVVNVTPTAVVSGGKYWIALLGTGGTLRYQDTSSGACLGQTNKTTGLTALPAAWTTGTSYRECPVSAYGSGSGAAQAPVLSVSTNAVIFSMVQGGANPSPASVNVANSGGGTLSFSVASDSSWLTASPSSNTAPATLPITASGSGLGVGVYTGHVTVTAPGVQGSPQVITVTFSVTAVSPPSQSGDWLTVDHDPARTGFAADETVLSPSSVANLGLSWSAALDGQITAQPLFVGAVAVGGATHDVVIAATSNNSVYALDAGSGSVLWTQNFGAQGTNCVFPGGFGVTGAPVIDRANMRVYAVSSDGVFHSLSLTTGAVLGQTPAIIANPATNSVWGGLNQNGNFVYVVTGSDGCDTQPWQGTIYKINVANPAPVLAASVPVVPSLASTNDAGGGIWGYGGLAIDTATGNLYVTSAADVNESTTPNANRMLVYDANLNLLGSYLPSDPATFPCASAPCDLDFGSSPVVFTPPSCPEMVLGGKKNGNLYLFKTSDLIASGQPTQILPINTASDSLGNGGASDPSYWPVGNMAFEGTAGTGANGFSGGIVAMNVTGSCTLAAAWSHPLGGSNQPNSTVTIANGVAFIGVGEGGEVLAYNATNGTQLWQSASGVGYTFAAPMVAKGSLYVGSWNGYAANSGGTLRAYSLNAAAPGPTLTVAPAALSFSGTVGGSNPPTQQVDVGNSGGGVLSFTAVSDSSWLTVSPASGTAPQALTIAAESAGQPAGTLTGHVSVSASGAAQSPQTVTSTLTLTASGGGGGSTVLLGDQTIETQLDHNPAGVAEAFQTTATTSGTADAVSVYLDANSSATQVIVGVYADNGSGHPGSLLTQVSKSQPTAGAWNTLTLPVASITQGKSYWVAILGASGTVRFHDRSHGGCSSETNATTNLSALPSTWTTGNTYTDCPVSLYVSQ